jgi:hypothetical protein
LAMSTPHVMASMTTSKLSFVAKGAPVMMLV